MAPAAAMAPGASAATAAPPPPVEPPATAALPSPASRSAAAAAPATTLHDAAVVACVAREARRLPLPADGPTDATLEVILSPGDEGVPGPIPLPSSDALRDALRAAWPAASRCYAAAMARSPQLGGRMELRFRLTPTGAVAQVVEGEPRFPAADVAACVLGVYRAAALPPLPAAAREGEYAYALHFELEADAARGGASPAGPAVSEARTP
jgi:hypothetical protein